MLESENLPPCERVEQLKATPPGKERSFRGVFLLKRATPRTGKNDSRFLVVELGDKTGSFQFVCFDNSPQHTFFTENGSVEGSVVEVRGITGFYQDRFSPKIISIVLASDQAIEESGCLDGLIETCPENPDDLWQELMEFTESIQNEELRQTVRHVWEELGEWFRIAPAALSMHHAYRHGLLEHTVHMARAGKVLLPLYPEVHADLAMAGILTHDVGKVLEYEGDATTRKRRKGILQGHVVLGYRIVRKAAIRAKLSPSLIERLEHIILSHQGELEWGAAVMAATPEAVFVSMVDNLDARMGMVQYLLRQNAGTQEFSEYHMGLKSPLLLTPPDDSEDAVP
jgi:3'-5' exoribonuclease